nr:MAG TPA: hypothetical protein [Caudoviricetes sp.]
MGTVRPRHKKVKEKRIGCIVRFFFLIFLNIVIYYLRVRMQRYSN